MENEPKSIDIESSFVLEHRELDENDEKTFVDLTTEEINLDTDQNELPIEQDDEWRSRPKHVFILSESGKPIYSL